MLRDKNEVVSDVNPMVPAHLHFGRHIIDNLKTGGDQIALIDGVTGTKLSYKQLVDSVARCACGLDRMGVKHGHLVTVLSDNRFEVLISVLASICCGAIASTINPSYSKDEFIHAMKIVKPSLVFFSKSAFERNGETLKSLFIISKLISFDNLADSNCKVLPFQELMNQTVDLELFEPREVKGQTDGAVVLFSSGTTGMPKGVVLTHMNLIIDGVTGAKLSYKQLVDSVARCACGLDRMGVKHGHLVTVLSENRFEVLISVLASICCGAIASTINPSYSKDEFIHAMKIVKPSLVFFSKSAFERNGETLKSLFIISKLISFDNLADSNCKVLPFQELMNQTVDLELFEPREVKGQTDGAVVLFSSGTTGMPKGVVLTHMNLIVSSTSISGKLMTESGVKTMLTVSPWSHSMGLITVFNYLNNLRTVVFLPRFDEELCYKLIQDYKINGFSVPSALVVLMAKSEIIDNYDLSSLKTLMAGSAPLSIEVIEIASKRLGGINICQGYGLTETTVGIIRDTDFNPRRKPKVGSSGGILAGVRVKVVDENGKSLPAYGRGEIRFKSPNVMKEYLGDSAATAQAFDEEGYFKTGDIGYYDSEGYFYVVDRIKELIKYKGFQVPPAEVEAVLLDHESVRECGVVGAPDELAGELPTAFIVRLPGSNVTEKELVDYVASKLSRAKHLHGGVRFIKELPKSGSGKVLRRILRDMCKNTPPSKL